jgi:methionyl-tRNA formyltransferase
MRVVLLTSNAIRHRFVANRLSESASDILIISECKKSDSHFGGRGGGGDDPIARHFRERYETEAGFFSGHECFRAGNLPLLRGEANLGSTCDTVRSFRPDVMFAFGSSIIREPLLTLLPPGRFINLHLGLSPYYRGSGTNFWPFVNEELEYVGATLLHIDAGIDTGDIIAHVRPDIEPGDNVHRVGCKVIAESSRCLGRILKILERGRPLNRVKQWQAASERTYRNSDFNEDVLLKYHRKIEDGLIERFLRGAPKKLRLISL